MKGPGGVCYSSTDLIPRERARGVKSGWLSLSKEDTPLYFCEKMNLFSPEIDKSRGRGSHYRVSLLTRPVLHLLVLL